MLSDSSPELKKLVLLNEKHVYHGSIYTFLMLFSLFSEFAQGDDGSSSVYDKLTESYELENIENSKKNGGDLEEKPSSE